MSLIKGDCLQVMKDLTEKSIDMVVVDLPYGQTACDWDVKIDLDLMWKELERVCKSNCNYIFFTTTKFGVELINSKPSWFRYDLVWEKSNSVGHLSANKMPLRTHEMIYVFGNPSSAMHDLNIERNLDNRDYAKKILKFINKPYSKIQKEVGHMKLCHFLSCCTSTQFSLPTRETYNELIEKYKINEMEGFINFDDLKFEKDKDKIYNPQKTPGKPYKVKAHPLTNIDVYGETAIPEHENISGDRHPKSIIKFNTQTGFHRTQKPVDLCEWLIKSYSNEGDLVMDFCMGSGTSVVACINTNRNYIGIEQDEDIFKIAKERIENVR
jgi:site-specific DNA-methyltransferase (adenine-specific)